MIEPDLPPLTLSSGRSLEDWLAHETPLGPTGASTALREYRRYLALVLAAAEGQTLIPSPRVASVWRLHREDTRAYAKFLTEAGSDRLHHHLARLPAQADPAYTACRAAYAAAFGPPPARWWPSPLMIRLRLLAVPGLLIGMYLSGLLLNLRITGFPADIANLTIWTSLGLLLAFPLTVRPLWSPRGSAPNQATP